MVYGQMYVTANLVLFYADYYSEIKVRFTLGVSGLVFFFFATLLVPRFIVGGCN